MSKNYILAKIEIPLELDEKEEIKLMEKYMKLEIEETDKELQEHKEMPGFEAILELFKSMKSDVNTAFILFYNISFFSLNDLVCVCI